MQTIEIIGYLFMFLALIFIIACSLADSFWIKTNKKELEKTKKGRIMMDTELGELIRVLIFAITIMMIIYILGDYHSRIKEYLRNRKQKKNELEKTGKDE
ncbi:hypothetical protein FDW47_09350 [Campylobacter helveticus]|uniref:hypothetical protein n=2 Tax=Campylobacter helveticus TaxID=28898 RepID=UPI0011125EAB|nr:hypothetical protein [Campylobacter helveticus]TNB54094.1 hypothetical protein FDW47_09350 [Campylobacter helveticus]